MFAAEPRPEISDLLGVGDEDGAVPGVAPRLPALREQGPGDPQGVRDSSVWLQALPRLHWRYNIREAGWEWRWTYLG